MLASRPSWWAQFAPRVLACGYDPLPLMPRSKVPGTFAGQWRPAKGWQRAPRPTPDRLDELARWPDAGLGLRLGTLIAVDIDIDAPGEADQVYHRAQEMLGATPLVVSGRPGRRKLFYRTSAPFAKLGQGCSLEILGRGQQAVAWAQHPSTRAPYTWQDATPADVPQHDLPLITQAKAQAFWQSAMGASCPPQKETGLLALPSARRAPQAALPKTPEALLHSLESPPHLGNWNNRVWALVGALKREGYSDADVLALAPRLTWPTYALADTRQTLTQMLGRIQSPSEDQRAQPLVKPTLVKPETSTPKSPRFELSEAAKTPLTLGEPYLIKGLVPRQGMTVLYGAPKVGKTFFALDLAAHIAGGLAWRQQRVRQGPVVYWTGEGHSSLNQRIHAWQQAKGQPAAGLQIMTGGFDALDPRHCATLISQLRAAPPALLILDTLARVFGAGDENSARDMGGVIAALDEIRAALGCALMLVHHAGKDKARGLRGSSVLLAAADQIIALDTCKHPQDSPILQRYATLEASRSQESGARYAFDLAPQLLGVDNDGERVYVPAVQPVPAILT